MPPVPILSEAAELAAPDTWFPSTAPSDAPPLVISITGPQASGKSTLANALFATQFPVASELGTATTRGIQAQLLDADPQTLILDVEGADARSRGRNGKLFASRAAAFVASLSDVIVLNLWYHDACRLDSAAYALLRSILHTCAVSLVDGSLARTVLIIAVRDADDESQDRTRTLESMIRSDADDLWADVALETGLPVGAGGTTLDELIDLYVYVFPHIRHRADQFNSSVSQLRSLILNGNLSGPEHSRQIPADGFAVYATTVWESLANASLPPIDSVAERGADDFYGGEDFAIVAAFRCDEVFSHKLSEASGEIGDLLDVVEEGTKVQGLGEKCDVIVNRFLQEYDVETTDFADEPVYERKRRELEAIIDTGLMSVFMKNIAILAREALTAFKTFINEEIPADFALYKAVDSFGKEAEASVRQGSGWTFETERVDLQNMMTEIASQQRKLRNTQVTASEQQSKAIQFLRLQHAQMQAVQQQAMGGGVGQWNVGAAYRPPDSNVNLSLAYQQGRTNLQVSMVPDESSTLLGPAGFTSGVGPGNLGLSFNVNF